MKNDDINNLNFIYDDIIEEAQRGHGKQGDVLDLLNYGFSQGLYRVEPTKNGWKLLSNLSRDIETIDRGERALHYLRRFINKLETFKKFQ